MTELRPFDLEAAKAGAKVLFNPYNQMLPEPCHFVGLAENGKPVIQAKPALPYGLCITEFEFLYMAPTPVKRWRVIYRGEDNHGVEKDSETFEEANRLWLENDFSTRPFKVEVTP